MEEGLALRGGIRWFNRISFAGPPDLRRDKGLIKFLSTSSGIMDLRTESRKHTAYYWEDVMMSSHLRLALMVALAVELTENAIAGPSLSPHDTAFSLVGRLTLEGPKGNDHCHISTSGNTSPPGISKKKAGVIDSGQLSGGCFITPGLLSLPWNISLTNSHGGTIKMGYFFEGYPCYPDVPFTVSREGVWKFDGTTPGCEVSGSLTSIPTVTIKK
jgi:hypothetical protein